MRDERAHAALLGQRERRAIVGVRALEVEPVGMGPDIAEEFEAVRHEVSASQRRCRGTLGQALGFVDQTEIERGAAKQNVDVAGPGLPLGRLIRQESLAFSEPAERPGHVAEMRTAPSGVGLSSAGLGSHPMQALLRNRQATSLSSSASLPPVARALQYSLFSPSVEGHRPVRSRASFTVGARNVHIDTCRTRQGEEEPMVRCCLSVSLLLGFFAIGSMSTARPSSAETLVQQNVDTRVCWHSESGTLHFRGGCPLLGRSTPWRRARRKVPTSP
jgi:hypothetical protein